MGWNLCTQALVTGAWDHPSLNESWDWGWGGILTDFYMERCFSWLSVAPSTLSCSSLSSLSGCGPGGGG